MEASVSTVIPGAKNAAQAAANSAASQVPALPAETMDALRALYQDRIAPFVHQRW